MYLLTIYMSSFEKCQFMSFAHVLDQVTLSVIELYEYVRMYVFRLRRMICGILVPQPGIKPMPPAVEVWSLNHWTTREVPV